MNIPYTRLLPGAIALAMLAVVTFRPHATAASQNPSHPIAQTALAKVGEHGGQCKPFVQTVVRQATGRAIGAGYRQAYLNAGAVEVSPAGARAGDILQISNPANHNAYYPGMHTAIVLENLGNGSYRVVDSNGQWDERVRTRIWTPRPGGNLRLYAYRFPGESAGGATGTSAAQASSVRTATVSASPCLYLRTGPSINTGAMTCLTTNSTVAVLSGPTTADGYTWVQVRTSSGRVGWVASEFLR